MEPIDLSGIIDWIALSEDLLPAVESSRRGVWAVGATCLGPWTDASI